MNSNSDNLPPRLPLRFFRWFCHPDLVKYIEGDLIELFEERVQEKGVRKAKLLFVWDVVKLFRPSLIRISIFKSFNPMIRHNILISYRNILRNKSSSLINIGGLALGMTVAILISLWVYDELNYNRNHENYEVLGKVFRTAHNEGGGYTDNSMVPGLATLLKNEYGNYFDAVALVRQRIEHRMLSYEDKKFTQIGYFAQPELPEMLTLNMIYGSRNGLKDINGILLSESVSNKLFGNVNPVGKVIKMDANWSLQVNGVYEDLPANSEFNAAGYLASFDRYIRGWESLTTWNNYFAWIYVQLKPGVRFNEVSEVIKDAMLPHLHEEEQASGPEIFVQPMQDWHLYSHFENGVQKTSLRLKFVWFYASMGIFMLLLACINFMNLSTARSARRAKEVGLRKTMGSARSQLIGQFLSEAILISFLAYLISMLAVWLLLPWFNFATGKQLVIPISNGWFWVGGLVFTLLTGFMAGAYPAFFLSSIKILNSLKGRLAPGRSAKYSSLPRKALVVFQFTTSICLIIGTIVIYNQIQLAKNRPSGYNQEQLITLHQRSPEYTDKYKLLRDELLKTGVVEDMASSNYSVISTLGWNDGFGWDEQGPRGDVHFNYIKVSSEYARTIGMEFVAGRDFSSDLAGEERSVLINESALEVMGLESPVGHPLVYKYGHRGNKNFKIIGVVKDMIKGSPFEPTFPSVIFLSDRAESNLYIKLKANVNTHEAIATVESVFNELMPSVAFDFTFADDDYERKFRDEKRIGQLAGYFAVITIFISCLGLFGLSSYVIQRRTKEIGIRKVLGASILNLWQLLSRDYLILVIISCFLAIPISNYLLEGWLQGYKIRTEIGWKVFVFSGLGALLITLLTVSFRTVKASTTNPVESLRDE